MPKDICQYISGKKSLTSLGRTAAFGPAAIESQRAVVVRVGRGAVEVVAKSLPCGVPTAASQRVVSVAAVEGVGALAAVDDVVSAGAVQRIVATEAVDE